MTVMTRPEVSFDPLDQQWRFDDLPLYRKIRDAGGIAWSPQQGGFWATTDIALCKLITSNPRFTSGEGVRIPPSGLIKVFALEYDNPDHDLHRKVLAEAVGARQLAALEPMIRENARRLISMQDRREIDLGEGYGFKLPLDVMFTVIGAPEHLKDEVEEIAGAIFIYRTPLSDGRPAGPRLQAMIEQMVADRTANPRDDWLSDIVTRRCPHSQALNDVEVQGAILALLIGGHHTTVRIASSLLAQIAGDDTLQRRLRDDPSLIPDAVNEAVRMFVPLGWFARTAQDDVELGDALVARGERVMVMYAGCNRDPKVFEAPDEFRLGRPTKLSHVGFGWGVHRCAGMQLAQLELKIAVEELFALSSWITLKEPVIRTSSSEARHIRCTLEPSV
jgi:cytochrome P450